MSIERDYRGMPDKALLEAAQYEPPTAALVKALRDRLGDAIERENGEHQEEISELQIDLQNEGIRGDEFEQKLESAKKLVRDCLDKLEKI